MVLDLFETMRDLIPEFEYNFSDQYCLDPATAPVRASQRASSNHEICDELFTCCVEAKQYISSYQKSEG